MNERKMIFLVRPFRGIHPVNAHIISNLDFPVIIRSVKKKKERKSKKGPYAMSWGLMRINCR